MWQCQHKIVPLPPFRLLIPALNGAQAVTTWKPLRYCVLALVKARTFVSWKEQRNKGFLELGQSDYSCQWGMNHCHQWQKKQFNGNYRDGQFKGKFGKLFQSNQWRELCHLVVGPLTKSPPQLCLILSFLLQAFLCPHPNLHRLNQSQTIFLFL